MNVKKIAKKKIIARMMKSVLEHKSMKIITTLKSPTSTQYLNIAVSLIIKMIN